MIFDRVIQQRMAQFQAVDAWLPEQGAPVTATNGVDVEWAQSLLEFSPTKQPQIPILVYFYITSFRHHTPAWAKRFFMAWTSRREGLALPFLMAQ